MNLEQEFLSCIVYGDQKNIINSDIRIEILTETYARAFLYCKEFHQSHSRVPGPDIIFNEFGLRLGPPTSDYEYIKEELKKRHSFNMARSIFTELGDMLKTKNFDNIEDKFDEYARKVRAASSRDSGLEDLFSAQKNQANIEKYNDREMGIYGVITPWQTLTEWTWGWQKGDLALFGARAGAGKCHSADTKILMYDGCWKYAKDIIVGDKLMGPDSKCRNVLSVTSGKEEMFTIIPTKGEHWGCNLSHILHLKCNYDTDSIHKKDQVYNYSVKEYLQLPYRVQHNLMLYRVPIDFLENTTLIDPYFFGLWIGDGTKRESVITNSNEEIGMIIQKQCERHELQVEKVKDKNTWQYRITGGENNLLLHEMKRSMIKKDGRKCLDLKIPQEYLVNSREKRLELLAVLLDTDGHVSHNGYEICTKFNSLKEDILFLCRSLGFAAYASDKLVKLKNNDFKKYYRITISGHCDIIPCRIKKCPSREQVKDVLHTGFQIKSEGNGTYYGFEIDSDHLYCLWDTTVTHNTWLLLHMAHHSWKEKKKIFMVTPEMSRVSILDRFASIHLKLNYDKIRKGGLSTASKKIYFDFILNEKENSGNLFVFSDKFEMDIEFLKLAIEREKPDCVYIDGVYLLRTKKEKDRMKSAPIIADGLKQMAKAYNVPIVCTTQFNRETINIKLSEVTLGHFALSDAWSWNIDWGFAIGRDTKGGNSPVMMVKPLKMREGEMAKEMCINWDFFNHDFSERKENKDTGIYKAPF
jgi:replicative DNA helicase